MTYGARKIILPDTPMTSLSPFIVQRNDIDYNNHVNNAQYVLMALDAASTLAAVGTPRALKRSAIRSRSAGSPPGA